VSEEITTVERLYEVLVQPWSGQHVSCHLVVGPLLSAPGSLYLDADQLRFRRASGLSGRLAPAKDIIISLLEVSHIQFSQADVGVTLQGGKTLWFRGKLLVYIVGWLYALGMPAEPTAGGWSLSSGKGILTTTFSSGLLQRHGVLAVGQELMVFLPLGSIDLSLGSWPLCIPLQDILKIEESSGTITVSSAAEEWSFLNAKTKQLMVPMSAALHPLESGSPLEDESLEGTGKWSGNALLVDRDLLAPGTLSFELARDELIFTMLSGEVKNLGSLLRARALGPENGDRFSDSLQSRDDSWRLQFPTDSRLLAQLLAIVVDIVPKLPPENQRIKPLKILQLLDAIRIDHDDGISQTYRPVKLTFSESTVDILLPKGRLDQSVTSIITNFTLLGRQVYQLRAMPWRLEDVEITELEPDLEEEFKDVEHIVRLRLPWPTTKQLQEHVNRRELYRISLSVGEQVILNVENQELPVKLLNLSAGGLGIMCRQEMTLGQQLVLAIGIPEADSEIETEVVWVRKEGDRYRLGLRFLNNNESFRQQMIQQMYRLELLESKGDRTPLKTLTGNTDEDSEDPT
jgi:hypothetical protein